MQRQQVFHVLCSCCGSRIGCYDSFRSTPKRVSCDDCHDYCPDANEPPSHSFCAECLIEMMDRISQRKMTEVAT